MAPWVDGLDSQGLPGGAQRVQAVCLPAQSPGTGSVISWVLFVLGLLEESPLALSQWHRLPTTQETDGFQVKRPGDVNVKCTLLLMLDHQVGAGGCVGAASPLPQLAWLIWSS